MRLFVWGSNTFKVTLTLVCPGFGRLWAHPFSSLALVTVATVLNPSPSQPSNRASTLGPRGLVVVRVLVITSPAGRL
jgi:hypothetical protein